MSNEICKHGLIVTKWMVCMSLKNHLNVMNDSWASFVFNSFEQRKMGTFLSFGLRVWHNCVERWDIWHQLEWKTETFALPLKTSRVLMCRVCSMEKQWAGIKAVSANSTKISLPNSTDALWINWPKVVVQFLSLFLNILIHLYASGWKLFAKLFKILY